MSNLDNWLKMCRPPKEALKKIGAGRLKGMSDINPQWRYKIMTEVFGPCGVGWKYDIVRLWLEPAVDGQVMAFSEIKLMIWVKERDEWSSPIPGIGGSMFVAQETRGLHASDECFKMATTDALSVAMKALGVGADIYAGLWDGSKYKTALVVPTEIKGDPSRVEVEKGIYRTDRQLDTAFFTDKLDAEIKNGKGKEHVIAGNFLARHKKMIDALPAQDKKDVEGYVKDMIAEYPGTSKPSFEETKPAMNEEAFSKWISYIRKLANGTTENFTAACAKSIDPLIAKLPKEQADALEDEKSTVKQVLQEEGK